MNNLKENDIQTYSKLPLMEHFYTIQGEGFNTGKPAYFLRLGGCDVGCVWCDVKESWDAEIHQKESAESMADFAKKAGAKNIVITGGEPMMYDLNELTSVLKEKGFQLFLESSGAYPLTGQFDWVCLSPKKFKTVVPTFYPFADELKIIVYHKSDLAWAEQHAAKVSKNCRLYLQPEWSKEKEMLPFIIEYIKENPKWTLSLQTHKYLNIP